MTARREERLRQSAVDRFAQLVGHGMPGLAARMERTPGCSLRNLSSGIGDAPDAWLQKFRPVLVALEHYHARGIIHRDIKPSNIIVTESGELRLIDFDVAAYRGARSTLPGYEDVRIGTLPYSAPEQILDPATATYETADIYSLGVVLYEMLTGRIPFPMTDDEDEEAYRARLPFEEPVPPTAYRPDLAPEIEAVLLKAMRRDPAARHQSVSELRVELEAAFGAAGVYEAEDSSTPPSILRRWPVLAIATALVPLIAWIVAST